MGAAFSETHDRSLMHAKQAKNPGQKQQREMGIGAESTIADNKVVRLKHVVHALGLRHVMRSQGGRRHPQEKSGGRVKQGHQMGHGKSTARLLHAGLTKGLLQLRCVGH